MSRIMIVVEFDLKPEHANDFITLMKSHAELSRTEDGCQQFDMLQAQDNPNKIFFVESWRDQAALDVHSKVPRMEENRVRYTPWLVSQAPEPRADCSLSASQTTRRGGFSRASR